MKDAFGVDISKALVRKLPFPKPTELGSWSADGVGTLKPLRSLRVTNSEGTKKYSTISGAGKVYLASGATAGGAAALYRKRKK
jgi:hypothetical protein